MLSLEMPQDHFIILDLQTTATSPAQGEILEFGWKRWSQCILVEEHHHLIKIKAEQVQRRIAKMTGLDAAELSQGIELQVALAQFLESACLADWTMIYYARFEEAFLKYSLSMNQLPFPVLCLHRLAKQLVPESPSYSLRGICGVLEVPLPIFNRTKDHVAASEAIFGRLKSRAEQVMPGASLQQLFSLTQKGSIKNATKARYRQFRPEDLQLPSCPGVYLMVSGCDSVLYVGKAKNLKNRVSSYFVGHQSKGSRLNEMICQIKNIRIHTVRSALEAAVIEAYLIKSLTPRYNVMLNHERTQEAFYLNRDLQETDLAGTAGFYGPFWNRQLLTEIAQLKSVWNGEAFDEVLPGASFTHDELFWALIGMLKELGLGSRDLVSFWQFCCRCLHWLSSRERTVGQEEETHWLMTEGSPERTILKRCAAIVRLVAQSRLHRIFSNCELRVNERLEETLSRLYVKKGVIDISSIQTSPVATVVVENLAESDQHALMSVLLSELKRVLNSSTSVVEACLLGREYDKDQLRKFWQWL